MDAAVCGTGGEEDRWPCSWSGDSGEAALLDGLTVGPPTHIFPAIMPILPSQQNWPWVTLLSSTFFPAGANLATAMYLHETAWEAFCTSHSHSKLAVIPRMCCSDFVSVNKLLCTKLQGMVRHTNLQPPPPPRASLTILTQKHPVGHTAEKSCSKRNTSASLGLSCTH